jgi:uncharacterized protein
MLLSFSIQNFRSFKAEQTLSLLASKRLGTTPASPDCFDVPGTHEQVLRVASLYGANAAGKSNLVQALSVLQQLIRVGTQAGKRAPFEPFLLDDKTSTEPSCFETQFSAGDDVFRYGVCYDANRVHEEWLSVYNGNRERNVFRRIGKEDGAIKVMLGAAAKSKNPRNKDKVRALAELGPRPNQLFLAEIVNLDSPKARGELFQRVVDWFTTTLSIIPADASFQGLAGAIHRDKKFAEFAGDFLRDASTGIAGLDVQIVRKPISDFPANFAQVLAHLAQDQEAFVTGPGGRELFLDGATKDAVQVRAITALHNVTTGAEKRLPFDSESDGTRRLLHLLPALYYLQKSGGVFVIDEIERSMHPMLARKFIEFFRRVGYKTKSQLIFTTHESTLLDLELMRRDGIWFAEKDQEGATQLHSLINFKVRNDLKIERGYLAGRFGAVPFLGGIDRLMEAQTAAESGT